MRARFTKKQADVLFACFCNGRLHSHFPNLGWVYPYAEPTEIAKVQSEQIALANAVSCCFANDYKKAQMILDNVFGKYPVLD